MSVSASDQAIFQLAPLAWVERFLILGTEGGTFYAEERNLTRQNAKNLEAAIRTDGPAAMALISDIYEQGRAPKQSPTMFALAMARAYGDVATRKLVYAQIRKLRTLSQLQELMSFHKLLSPSESKSAGGTWSRGLRAAVADWFNSKPIDQLSYQMAKYQQRYGFASGDLLNLSHPWAGQNFETSDPERHALYRWATGKTQQPVGKFVQAMVQARKNLTGTSGSVRGAYIREHQLSHEMVPTEWKQESEVWMALLESMPLGAIVRNLGNLAKAGLLTSNANATARVVASLGNTDWIHKSRLHPISILQAYTIYNQGYSFHSTATWTPNSKVTAALDQAFYLAFKNVQPAKKNTLLALDVSGSMQGGVIAGVHGLTPAMGSTAMALVTLATEPSVHIRGFSNTFREISITKGMPLDQALKLTYDDNFGSTDCSLPMTWAAKNMPEVETFIVYTDSETNSHSISPHKALEAYRQKTGIDAKLIVVGMTASDRTIADPKDANQLNVVGFDTAAPIVMNDFSRGSLLNTAPAVQSAAV